MMVLLSLSMEIIWQTLCSSSINLVSQGESSVWFCVMVYCDGDVRWGKLERFHLGVALGQPHQLKCKNICNLKDNTMMRNEENVQIKELLEGRRCLCTLIDTEFTI